ncbi:MAG: DNA polymerase IV [Candidatus Nanoarchaeia archaeon]
MRIILHIDLDYFYAQVEEVLNPELKGKPVVVGADPKKGRGRGVVSTCNYEARKYGIHSGMPISIAYRKCLNCIFLPVNMDLYVEVSARIMSIFRKYADEFELGGIDECYLNVSEKCKNYKQAEELALKIKSELKQKEKLTCSIGIGPNKLIAKIAAGRQKPDGLTTVKPEQVKEFLRKLSVRELIGVGPKTEAVLNQMSIFTIGQLAKISKSDLIGMFGKFGSVLYDEARGIDESPLVEEWEAKSMGRQVTFEKDTKDKKLVLDKLSEIVSDTIKQLGEEKLSYKTITVKVRYEDFYTTSRAETLKTPHRDEKTAQEKAKELIEIFLHDERRIRLIGFSLSNLSR